LGRRQSSDSIPPRLEPFWFSWNDVGVPDLALPHHRFAERPATGCVRTRHRRPTEQDRAMAEHSPAMNFITEYLKKDPNASYGEISKAAEEAGHKIYPIMYGRAKSLLGLIPEGGGRTRRRKAARATQARRLRQGRGGKLSDTAVTELSGFVDKFRDMEEERNRYRAALLTVEKILRDALEEEG